MALSAQPYQAFLTDLGSGVHDFNTMTYKMSLLTSDYTPDYTNHFSYDDVSSQEVLSTSGTNYSAQTMNVGISHNANTGSAVVNGQIVEFTGLSATFRYAVIYKSVVSALDSRLVGLIDFGNDRTYSNEDLVLVYYNDILTISADV